jgi:CrcB protein
VREVLLISLGAVVGANARYFAGLLTGGSTVGTLAVNVLGSLAVGTVLTLWPGADDPRRLLLAVGFTGSFTTFSAFSFETLAMARQGEVGAAAVYVVGSVALCLAATAAGVAVGRMLST